ncbi:hypothetical protein [Cohnella terricola]|uniref:Uncharacterized protein n=1 Tax=Cohnella terricola TaxID=1289167 RepID=A0A559JEB0_9BACL|nr:hypothetical protein [Cohnella terricola]TVX98222.1 hypothetical protein FPZ45_16105 [Cohnella terricola]
MGGSRKTGGVPLRSRQSSESWTQGSVTVYFIAATAAFLLITALLIDFARIAAFRKQAELSVKSGVRSTLSSFDPLIYARYGLFIRGGEQANEVFKASLEGNSALPGEGTFAFLDTRWEGAEVTESRPLAAHDVFRRQILEEMKYKAPIDLALEVATRFRGLSGSMKEAAKTVDLLEKMRKSYDRREEALDKVFGEQREQGGKIGQLLDSAVGSASGLIGGYEDYVTKRLDNESRRESLRRWEENREKRVENGEDTEEIEKDRPEGPRYEAEVAAYESSAAAASASLSKAASSARSATESFITEAAASLLKAIQANDEMIAIIDMARSQPASSVEDTIGEPEDKDRLRTMEELRRAAEDLVMDQAFFREYDAEIHRQHAQGLSLAGEASSFASLVGSIPGSTGMGPSLGEGESRIKSALTEFIGDYGGNGRIIRERQAIFESYRSYDSERKQEEQKAKSEWSGAAKFLGSLAGVSGSEEEKTSFNETNARYIANREWNKTEEEPKRAARSDDPSEGRDEAMASSNGLMDLLQGALIGARDQLYYSEYAIGRLSRFDPPSVKHMIGGGDVSLNIHDQETEYVLYGINNPAGNIAAAYGEIFAFRLAIRTMEGLIECRSMGHPLLVLAAALVYGISKAMLDMNALLNTGRVQLSKYIKVDTIYTDYLRLFLLIHGGTGSQMSRTIAVMEHASGLDFSGAYTYASGEGTASVRLWFFPGLLKIMGRFGNLGGTVKGNRYEATYVADSSYQ